MMKIPTMSSLSGQVTFVAHEIYQREDGTLGCRVPQTVWDAFKEKTVLADETLKRESGRVTKQVVSNAGDCYRFETTVIVKDGLRSFSVGLRDNEETGCQLLLYRAVCTK